MKITRAGELEYRVAGIGSAAVGALTLLLGPQRLLGVVGLALGVVVALDEVLAARGVQPRRRTVVKAALAGLTFCYMVLWWTSLRR